MSANPCGALRAIADCIGSDLDPTSQQAIIDATGKRALRRNAGYYAPEARIGRFKDDADSFSGRDQQAEHLTDAQRARMFTAVRTALGEQSAAWLRRTWPA